MEEFSQKYNSTYEERRENALQSQLQSHPKSNYEPINPGET